jgi:hypothetical protein
MLEGGRNMFKLLSVNITPNIFDFDIQFILFHNIYYKKNQINTLFYFR